MNDQQNSDDTAQQSPLDKFAESLLEEKKYPELLPEVREQLKNDLLVRIDDFLAARIIAGLTDEDVAAFEKLLNAGAQATDIQQFAVDHIPNFEEFLTQTLMEFRAVYLGLLDTPMPAGDFDEGESEVAETAVSEDNEETPPPAPVN